MINKNAIGDICQKTNYNSQEQELQQWQIEVHFSHVVREFIKDPNPGNSILSRDFLKFLCFMMDNNVYYRKQISRLLSNMELVLKILDLNTPCQLLMNTEEGWTSVLPLLKVSLRYSKIGVSLTIGC